MPPDTVEVRKVVPGGWADKQGIEPGDTFMEIDGKAVHTLDAEQFKDMVKNVRPLVFRVPTPEELEAAVTLQAAVRGSQARMIFQSMRSMADGFATTQDWRRSRTRAATREKDIED